MFTRLIAISQPTISGPVDASQLLAYCARVSNTANQDNTATGPKLIRSLVKRKEWSPLEMISLTMEITTTRDIARQILRHRSFSFQEFSQRYAKVDAEPVLREARLRHATDRQMSLESNDEALDTWWRNAQSEIAEKVDGVYQEALERGIAKEVARTVLPEGMTASRLYMAGTLRSWVHYVQLRTTLATQKEHREVAESCAEILRHNFPDLTDLIVPLEQG